MSRRRHPFVPVVAWAFAVGLASVTPPGMLGGTPDGGGLPFARIPHVDLLFHFVGYAILAALLVRALPLQSDNSSRTPPHIPLVFVVVVTVAFGLGIEGVQALLPYRTPSLLDASANLLGAVFGAVLKAASARNL